MFKIYLSKTNVVADIQQLPASDLIASGEALFDFDEISDLSNWLEAKQ